ncbi:D-3-phosphoglycerate dehydrogenase, chloroplastic [Hordeum vulgare]|nr:D-3-phosphoglycerate dehydrogenase, chloroplastic [Hordeum vulgare]
MQPAHQVNAVRRGSIRVHGACFNICPWYEHDLATFDSLLLHVRVVIEKVPMHFWSVEGAEEILSRRVRVDRLDSWTLERGHTKTFACWVWATDIADIPTSHTLGVLPCGAGRVEEMKGFSPPDRRVAPPSASAEYAMLIHVDRVEDWTQPSPRSSHSAQSGLPSSGSDDEDPPFPLVAPASWTLGVEDGEGGDRLQCLPHAPVASLGCRGGPRDGRPRDRDDEGGLGAGGRRGCQDRGLRCSGHPAHTSREDQCQRQGPGRGVLQDRTEAHLGLRRRRRPSDRRPHRRGGGSGSPLEFVDATLLQASGESVQLDAFSPTLSAAASELGQFHKATPSAATTMEVQLGAVTGRVRELEIGGAVAGPESRGLFRTSKQQPLIATAPARRPAAPPKTRATSTPTRSSARQAAIGSSVPVAQRASLRIVKELGLLGPRYRLTAEVAKALLQRFEEPLSDSDISVIARLTHLDSEALRVMARMNGPDGAADEATV